MAYALLAAGFFLAASGVFIRPLPEVPTQWLFLAWGLAFSWLFVLIRFQVFAKSNRLFFLLGTVLGLQLLAQSTGGEQSPLLFAVFILMGTAAWEGEARFGFWVAISFCLLEVIYLRREDSALGFPLFLRWAAYLVSAFFLSGIVKTRREKEKEKDSLDYQLKTLKSDAVHLVSNAEPSSFNVPKDKLLKEEGRLSARVGTVMEMEDTLTRQLSLFQNALSLQTAGFFFLTQMGEKKILRLRAHASTSDSVAPDVTLVPGETLVGLAAKEGRRVLLNDIAAESSRALPYYVKPVPVGSFLAQPIFLKNGPQESLVGDEMEMVGILVLDHPQHGFFNEKVLELIDPLVLLIAEVVQNVRVLHFSRTKTRNLHALFEVSNSFAAHLEVDKVLETAIKTAREIALCDSTYIALLDGNERSFSISAWLGPKGVEKPEKVEDELAAWMLEHKKPIRYSRGLREKSLNSFTKKEGMLGSTQSFLMVPLMGGEEVQGVIRLNSSQPNAYQSYDQDVLVTLANQTAMALGNAFMVEQIREMAIRDGLTGCFNHRYFQERLGEEMVKAERYNKDLCLALLDVDHFKKFNDTYGHQEGDRVLRIVSEVIRNTVRNKIDTVARYGGEEFAVILPECDGNAGKEWADRIRKNVESYLFENNGKPLYRVTVSVGVSTFPFDSREQKVLIQLADKALYEAKKNGRNRVELYKPSIG